MAAAQATGHPIPASEVYPRTDPYHAGYDPKTEREVRERLADPAQWELVVRYEDMLLAYLRGVPSQRSTALGNSIDRNAIMGSCSRICERCGGGGVLRPAPIPVGAQRLLGLTPDECRNLPACEPHELIGAPRRGEDEHQVDPASEYAVVRDIARVNGMTMTDLLCRWEPWCPDCRGNGHIGRRKPAGVAITAQQTGGSKAPWRQYDDRVGELVEFGLASGVMRRVVEQNPVLELVLVSYFGTTGERWAGSIFGKVFAVYPFTSAGGQLLRRTRNRAGEADPWQRLFETASAPNPGRDVQALKRHAGVQAVRLLRTAGEAWNREAASSIAKRSREQSLDVPGPGKPGHGIGGVS